MKILTRHQAIKSDRLAMVNLGVPSAILMENAAKSSFDIINDLISPGASICIIAGNGNNGGDGFAIARHLHCANYVVTILFSGDINKSTPETKTNYEIAKKLNIEFIESNFDISEKINSRNFDCYIESMIGIGGSENLRKEASDLLAIINSKPGFKVAIDIPAGLNPDTGKASPDAFRANLTITMFAPKIGMYLNSGKELCGDIRIASLGVPTNIIEDYSNIKILDKNQIRELIPVRDNNYSKFDFGRVLIIAGSEKYPGAASLCANAAVRGGAGLVELASTSFHNSLFPEVIQIKLMANNDGTISYDNYNNLKQHINKCDALAIGPGLGSNFSTQNFINQILLDYPDKKIVVDADGLYSIDVSKKYNCQLVLTPHFYEFCKIFGLDTKLTFGNEFDMVSAKACELNCIIHLKGKPSITSDGVNSVLTINGNSGMSTGGSGDVLTGIMVSMMTKNISTLDSVAAAAYIHAAAGDQYIKTNNKESLRASDLIENLKVCY